MSNARFKILWQSTAPWCPTGYGRVTGELVPRLKAKGYDIDIFAYFGLKDAEIGWNGIRVYPNNVQDYGQAKAQYYYDKSGANCLITLEDIWIFQDHGRWKNWFPLCPVDHEPMPPPVQHQMTSCVRPIAMSLFGKEMMAKEGFDPLYIPHGVDHKLFYPNADAGNQTRKNQGWGDRFVVGTIATNKGERKNFRSMLEGFARFHSLYRDSVFYCHTNPVDGEGYNLIGLCATLGLSDSVYFMDVNAEYPVEVMNAFYNSFDVFLLASKGEGFGIPIIEAQASGTPVIIPNYTSMKDLMGGGWLIREFKKEWTLQNSWWCNVSPETVSEYLVKAYNARRNGTIARKKAEAIEFSKQYDWDYVVDQYAVPALETMRPYCAESARFYRLNSPPKVAKVTLTNRCNARCKSCLTPEIKGEKGAMSKSEFMATMRLLADSGRVGYIMLSNIGEMFLIPEVDKWVDEIAPYIHKRNIRLGITTNGLLAKIPKGVDDFIISFNGWDKASYEDMVGMDYDKVMANIRAIVPTRAATQNVQIHYCSFDGTNEHEKMFAEQFADMGIPLRISRKIENQFGACRSEMADIQSGEERVPCNYLGFINVHWNGDIIMCAHDFEGSMVWGNLWRESIDDIWRGKAIKAKQGEHYKGEYKGLCKSCNYNTLLGDKVYYFDTAKLLREKECLTVSVTK